LPATRSAIPAQSARYRDTFTIQTAPAFFLTAHFAALTFWQLTSEHPDLFIEVHLLRSVANRMGLRAVYALNILERKRRPVVRPETFSQVPDDPLCEAYLDVTENLKGMEIATEIAQEIRAKIKQVTGLNASAGISYKFVAKMASDLNKPNGQAVITPKNGPGFVEALPVKKFHGVGPATAERLGKYGIETGLDLKSKSLVFLTGAFRKVRPVFLWPRPTRRPGRLQD
jgi:hypothetical protein